MSAANLDEIKKKYNFKEISVATWRDPSLSVHPVRGGPDSPRFVSPESLYVPNYKANYALTDDEDSGSEGEEDGDREEVPIDSGLEDPLHDLPGSEQAPDTPIEDHFEPEQGLQSEDQIDEFEQIDEQGLKPADVDEASDMAKEDNLNENDAAIDAHDSSEHPPETGDADLPTLEPLEDGAEAGAATPPSDAGSDERRVSFAPGTPDPKPTQRKKKAATGTKKKKKRIAVPIDSLPADVMAMIDGAFEGLPPPPPPPPPAPEPPVDDDFALDDAPKGVENLDQADGQDAPPPEEPLVEDAPPMAAEDEPAAEEANEVPTEAPAETPTEDSLDVQEAAQPSEATDAPAAAEEPPAEVPAMEPIEEILAVIEKPSKKKSSKSGKDKDKSKKKSSKTKSRDISPPPLGLGIDLPPPPPPPPVVEDVLDDVDIPAPTDLSEPATDIPPPEDFEKTAGETPDGPGPGSDNQDAPEAGDVPESITVEPTATEAPNADQPGEAELGADDSNQAPTDEPEQVAERSKGGEGPEDVPDALDEAEAPTEASAVPSDAKEEHEGAEAGPPDGAPSPVDSGVEFEDDGAKPANEELDAEASGSIDEPDKESTDVADHGEDVGTGAAAAEGEVKEDQPGEDNPAVEVSDAAGDPSTSEAVEAQDAEAQQESGEAAEGAAAEVSEATASPDETAPETFEAEVEADEPAAEPPAEGNSEGTAPEEPIDDAANKDVADPEEDPAENDAGEPESKTAVEDEAPPAENVADEGDTGSYEPPTVESVSEEAKVDPFEFEVVAEPEGIAGAELEQEASKEVEAAPEAPPSPVLSKSDSQGSHKHKADHWQRKHADNPIKEVFEDSKVLERTHSSRSGKDELRVRDRHRKSRRMSSSGDDDGERRKRRAARKEAERKEAEAARLAEELRRRAEDERKHREHQERRAAKQRAAEESATQKDVETRSRHRERDVDRTENRSTRPLKATLPFALPAIPKALNLTSGESVHGTSVVRSYGGAYRPASKEAAKPVAPTSAPRDEVEPKAAPRDAKTASPPSSGGEKSPHRHRHRRHRSDGDRSSRNGKESDRHHRRPALVEERVEARPRSFLGFVKI